MEMSDAKSLATDWTDYDMPREDALRKLGGNDGATATRYDVNFMFTKLDAARARIAELERERDEGAGQACAPWSRK